MKLTTVSNSMLQHRFRNLHLAHLWFPLCVLLIAAVPAQADGLLQKGHFHGSHTDLLLNSQQMSALKNLKYAKDIPLTPEQKAVLCKKFPFATGINSLWVVSPISSSCSCEAINVAVTVAPNKIEVSDDFLAREFDDYDDWCIMADKAKWLERQHIDLNSGDVQILRQADVARKSEDHTKAVELLQQLLQRNSNIPVAKNFIVSSLTDLGETAEKDMRYDDASNYYKKALFYIDKSRVKQIWLQQQKIKKVELLASRSTKN